MNLKIISTFILSTTFVTIALTQESRWVTVAKTDRINISLDAGSIKRTDSKVKVWLKWIYSKPEDTFAARPKRTYLSEKTLDIYDCADRKVARLQNIRHIDADTSSEVVETLSTPEHQVRYTEVAPETIGEAILTMVCEATAGKK